MKLYPLVPTSKLATNIAKISKKLRMGVVITKAERLDCVVIIANGTPDDIAFSVVCYIQMETELQE